MYQASSQLRSQSSYPKVRTCALARRCRLLSVTRFDVFRLEFFTALLLRVAYVELFSSATFGDAKVMLCFKWRLPCDDLTTGWTVIERHSNENNFCHSRNFSKLNDKERRLVKTMSQVSSQTSVPEAFSQELVLGDEDSEDDNATSNGLVSSQASSCGHWEKLTSLSNPRAIANVW